MKDVAALLKEIRRPVTDEPKEAMTASAASLDRSMALPGSSNCSLAMSDYSS